MKLPHALAAVAALAGLALALQDKVTYDDTPFLPGGRYRVHGERPWPPVVDPGGPGRAPADAVVLFDGSGLDEWRGGDGPARWKLVDGGAMEVNGTGSVTTRREFGDMQLHLEFATPAAVAGSSQGRGNSGVFLMGRYEVQVLDSHENPTYPDGQCAAMYGQRPPAVNASRGPGEWQSYDIVFRAPRFEGGELAEPARVTVLHNGVLVHHDQPFLGATAHRALAKYSPHGPKGPIQLQDHGNPVRYRNIWVRELAQQE
jgi:hypothetical protein